MKVIKALGDEVDVQPGATVTKVIEKDGPLRLVLFAFDEGEELTEHTASVPVVLQIVSGSATVGASGAAHRLVPNDWLYLEAGEPHTVLAHEPTKMLLTMVRPGS